MIAAAMVMVLSVGLPAVAEAAGVPSIAHPATSSAASTPAASAPTVVTTAGTPKIPTSPHPGTLDVYLNSEGGATTVDPSVAYYTTDYEPIMNVYEALIAYNGTSTSQFVPVAATCVPGTVQCTEDYGTSMTGYTGIFNYTGGIYNGSNGEPAYWNFVIDPAAHFYDHSTGAIWPVYPSDVMFSLARTMAYSDLPYVAAQSGWIEAQALDPIGNHSFDTGMHFPFNTTPYDILTSMMVNDTQFCPATAMNGVMGDGCITFNATGEGIDWPSFLDFVEDQLGSSIQPCGWYSASPQDAGLPGFPGTTAANGDGSCLLPGNVTSTNDTGYLNYLATVAPGTPGMYSWDAYENLTATTPVVEPGVMSVMLGSGPYWGSVSLASGYGLGPSKGYEQPSACGGNPTDFAQYTGYCYPAPGKFIGNVSVEWLNGDSVSIADYTAGTADYGDIEPAHTATMLALQAKGKLNIVEAPSLSVFQQDYVDYWNASARSSLGLTGFNNIPADFFSYIAARGLLQMSYPFETIESQVWTVSGLETLLGVGGQIPYGMACYYAPTTANGCTNSYTVPFPYLVNGGVVNTNPKDNGSAAWWWAQGLNSSSPYYDPQLAACTAKSPCQFTIESATGAPSQDAANDIWISSIETISGGALMPNTADIPPADLLTDCGEATPMTNPCSVFNFGWIPDYPDPTDYEAAYGLPNGTYTGPDANGQMLLNSTAYPQFDNPTACGHYGDTFQNLTYWANVSNSTTLANDCQGPAYAVYSWATALAGSMSAGPERILYYDLGQTIMNALNFYTWTGQGVDYVTAAPWIQPSTLNTNVMIGTGDDQFWFMLKYENASSFSTIKTTFDETGLGKGVTWNVLVSGQQFSSSKSKLLVSEPVGKYTYSVSSGSLLYKPTAKTGSFTVTSTPGSVSVSFMPVLSLATFKESGLAKGTVWTVHVGSSVATGNTSVKGQTALTAYVNGTESWTASAPGYMTVTGTLTATPPTPVTEKVKFTPYNKFFAYFNETGLTTGAKWSVALKLVKGTGLLSAKPGKESGTGTSLSWLDLANGTYTYTASAKGYGTLTGTVIINGTVPGVVVNLTFVSSSGVRSTFAPAARGT